MTTLLNGLADELNNMKEEAYNRHNLIYRDKNQNNEIDTWTDDLPKNPEHDKGKFILQMSRPISVITSLFQSGNFVLAYYKADI